jgi:hypothetical protein
MFRHGPGMPAGRRGRLPPAWKRRRSTAAFPGLPLYVGKVWCWVFWVLRLGMCVPYIRACRWRGLLVAVLGGLASRTPGYGGSAGFRSWCFLRWRFRCFSSCGRRRGSLDRLLCRLRCSCVSGWRAHRQLGRDAPSGGLALLPSLFESFDERRDMRAVWSISMDGRSGISVS